MDDKKNILVVDDDEQILKLQKFLLETNSYKCTLAINTAEARNAMQDQNFEVVLCDVNMPGESGMDFARYVLTEYADTAVLMVTAVDDPEIARTALEIGAYGYIIKPFKPNELIIDVANALRRRDLEIKNRDHRENLEKLVAERTERLQDTLESLRKAMGSTIRVISSTVEMRDPYTAGHQQRVTTIACAIATEMGLPEDRIDGLRMAGVIHDLGKIAVPAEILSKPGEITEAEFSIIKSHPQVGNDILKDIEFPWPIAEIVYQHHERMDGSGYPQGLSGEDILLEARILCVADVVEAMASHRPYRPALGIEKALDEISENKGVFYDPEVVGALFRLKTSEIEKILR
ncbi:MAG: response regulator [Desulfobacteraceae bacterium]|nr:response regulator [Desulfobacteraceae bacterium]